MEFSGNLFQYDTEERLNAFETSPSSDKTVVFIGGLGDGFNAVPFLAPLYKSISALGWSLTQVQLSSSVGGFGTSNLQTDCRELDTLVEYLKSKRQKKQIVFIGHSTGNVIQNSNKKRVSYTYVCIRIQVAKIATGIIRMASTVKMLAVTSFRHLARIDNIWPA